MEGDTEKDARRLSDEAFKRGRIYGDNKEYENAIKCYSEALEIYPDNYEARIYRGVDYYKIREYDKAIEDFDTILRNENISHDEKADEYISRAFKNKGNVYFLKEEYTEAIKLYDEALKYKRNEKALNNKGTVLYIYFRMV